MSTDVVADLLITKDFSFSAVLRVSLKPLLEDDEVFFSGDNPLRPRLSNFCCCCSRSDDKCLFDDELSPLLTRCLEDDVFASVGIL